MPVTHRRTCHICEANCGIVVTAEGHDILSIKGDPDNALSRGHICPKAIAIADLQNDPDRLRRPVKRVGEGWQDISWEQAFAEIGEKTRAIMARDGASTALYIGNPNAHNYGNVLNIGHLRAALGTRNVFSASTVDQMPHQVVNLRLYGHSGMWTVPDIDRTDTMVILGANPMASNGSVWTVPDFRNRVKALQARGGQMIVIDPRRTETAKIADRHVFVKPGTDAFLLIALLKALRAKGLPQVADYLRNAEAVWRAFDRFDTDLCLKRAGVSADDIDTIASRMLAGRAVPTGGSGPRRKATGRWRPGWLRW